MQRVVVWCGFVVLSLGVAGCERKGDLAKERDRPMPVGTRNNGEGPNPDTKGSTPHLDASSGEDRAEGEAGRVSH